MKKTVSLILVMFVTCRLFSQDTLPKFTLVERADRVTISWTNPFQGLVQLNVQRSYDSLKNFSTIFSAPSPQLPQNGYTDTKPASNRYFYRIFYAQEGGTYFFTHSRRAGSPTTVVTSSGELNEVPVARDLTNSIFSKIAPNDKRVVTVKIKDVIYKRVPFIAFPTFRDSILLRTKDTLYAINDTSVGISIYKPLEVYRASNYVFVNKDGYINISLPLANEKRYDIKFFEQDGTSLFEIDRVKEPQLILDKENFVHSGWFLFELYEDNKLKEKNRLFIPKEF